MAKKPMTKARIVSHFGEKVEISKRMASAILDKRGGGLGISGETRGRARCVSPVSGIGKLGLSKRKARTARNPATGDRIKIPPKIVVKMRTARTFLKRLLFPEEVKSQGSSFFAAEEPGFHEGYIHFPGIAHLGCCLRLTFPNLEEDFHPKQWGARECNILPVLCSPQRLGLWVSLTPTSP